MSWWLLTAHKSNDVNKFRLAGCVLGACLLIKPTFFAHTLAIAALLTGIGIAGPLLAGNGQSILRKVRTRSLLEFSVIGFLIALPYYLINGRQTFNYFWTNTRGPGSEIWSMSGDVDILNAVRTMFAVTFHVLGYHWFYSTALVILGVALFLRKGRSTEALRLVGMCVIAVASIAIISFGRHLNEFFLATAQWTILLTGALSLGSIELLTPRVQRFLAGVAVASLIVAISYNARLIHWNLGPDARHGWSWNEAIVNVIKHHRTDQAPGAHTPVVFMSFTGDVGPDTLKWVASKGGLDIQTSGSYFSSDLEQAKATAAIADYVVIPNNLYANYYRSFGGSMLQTPLLEWVLAQPQFRLLTPPDQSARYFVFANKPVLDLSGETLEVEGTALLQGFLNEEGPYPQWQLPRVRWMTGQKAQLCLLNPSAKAYRTKITARPNLAGSLVVSYGLEKAQITLQPGQFGDLTFTFVPVSPQKDCLDFFFNPGVPIKDDERSLLFKKIEIRTE